MVDSYFDFEAILTSGIAFYRPDGEGRRRFASQLPCHAGADDLMPKMHRCLPLVITHSPMRLKIAVGTPEFVSCCRGRRDTELAARRFR